MSNTNTPPITVGLVPEWVHDALLADAQQTGRTVSAVVRTILDSRAAAGTPTDFAGVPTKGARTIHVRLPRETMNALNARSSASGHTRTKWIILALCAHYRASQAGTEAPTSA